MKSDHIVKQGEHTSRIAGQYGFVALRILWEHSENAELKDQLRRAVGATVRNIAEGANRVHPKDKAARFIVARAECAECEASLQMVEVLGLGRPRRLRIMADRVAAMLWGLIKRENARARSGVLRGKE